MLFNLFLDLTVLIGVMFVFALAEKLREFYRSKPDGFPQAKTESTRPL